jgi:hypothetical protein
MDPIKNEVAVMFSGGIDSLLAAVLLAQEYDKVHLVTFDKGYLEFGVKNNQPNVELLKEKIGADRITHQVVDIKDLHKAISVRFFFKERKKYNSEIRWCVGCRLSMGIAAMIFSLENSLVGYADGSNREQIPSDTNLTGTAENYPSIVNAGKTFAQSYGVHFLTPTYDFGGRELRRQKLSEMGFAIDYLSQDHSKRLSGMMTKEVVKRSQPMCFSGWLMHWKRNLLGKPIDQNEPMTVDYVRGKQDNVVREVMAKYFAGKGLDLEAIVKARLADPRGQFKPTLV